MQIPKDFPSKDIEDKPISNLRKKFLYSMLRSLLLKKGEEAFQICKVCRTGLSVFHNRLLGDESVVAPQIGWQRSKRRTVLL